MSETLIIHKYNLKNLRFNSIFFSIWEEGQLLWTDGSPYLLKDNILSLSMIPENQTDCYALQRDPTGPDYFFTGFFCYVQLPDICEYECDYIFSIFCNYS